MANSTFCFVQGSTRPFFAVQLLKESDHTVVSLAGASVGFSFRHVDSTTAAVSAQSCNITDATNGKVEYRWQSSDLNVPGTYNAEFRVTFADATIQAVIIRDVTVFERV